MEYLRGELQRGGGGSGLARVRCAHGSRVHRAITKDLWAPARFASPTLKDRMKRPRFAGRIQHRHSTTHRQVLYSFGHYRPRVTVKTARVVLPEMGDFAGPVHPCELARCTSGHRRGVRGERRGLALHSPPGGLEQLADPVLNDTVAALNGYRPDIRHE